MQTLNIEGLSYAYSQQASLFNRLSLQLGSGGIIGLLGKNGAGKTTLLKLIAGLLYPQAGILNVGQHVPSQRRPDFLGDIFVVPEEFYLPPITMTEFVRLNGCFYPRFDETILDRLATVFELDATDRIDNLSYGQKKRFLIAFALATRCRLLMLDEPTNGLDIPSKAMFRKVMAGSLSEDQLVLISTHQVKDVDNLIDRVVILSNGQIILNKEVHDISTSLHFELSPEAHGDDILYSETSAGGFKVIRPRVNGHSAIDIELLFNAVTNGIKLFQHE